MLTLPPKGINVLSIPPPSADAPSESNSGKQPRQLMFITLNDQILSQILATGGKGLSVTFGGSNAGLKIGDKVHQFSTIIPETGPYEVYRCKEASSSPKLDMIGRVSHKIQVRRGLDSTSMERIKNRTEEAERERNSRKAVLLEKPPPSKRTASVAAHVRHNSSGGRSFLSIFENKPGVKGSGVRSLPSSPLLRPSNAISTPKYLPIGGSPRIAPVSPPRLQPLSSKTTVPTLRVRLIHMLALGPATEQTLQEKTRALRTELSTCLQDVARKTASGSTLWELKDESYRDLKPREWKNYTSKERETVEKKQMEILARLPAIEPEPKITEIPKKRTVSDVSDEARPLAMTPVAVESPVIRASVPAKRPAQDEVVNPVRKVGGAIITSKKKATKVSPKIQPVKTTSAEKPAPAATSKPSRSKTSAKENSKIKSAEKVIDSSSDEDIPLERQAKHQRPTQAITNTTELKGLGISSMEQDTKKRQPRVISPPASNTYRSRTSSASSSNSNSNAFSPPKKRSPLATNEPITARRTSPTPPSPPPSAKKRQREEDPLVITTTTLKADNKRPKLAEKPRPQPISTSRDAPLRETSSSKSQPSKRISQEYHDLADRFRKLYPEYQQLHRRLQGLDERRLAMEKPSIDRLFQLQEKLEKWKTALWKVAGESRPAATATGRNTPRTVGVKV